MPRKLPPVAIEGRRCISFIISAVLGGCCHLPRQPLPTSHCCLSGNGVTHYTDRTRWGEVHAVSQQCALCGRHGRIKSIFGSFVFDAVIPSVIKKKLKNETNKRIFREKSYIHILNKSYTNNYLKNTYYSLSVSKYRQLVISSFNNQLLTFSR